MDSIDITDSTFSLETCDISSVGNDVSNVLNGGGNETKNTMFIYVGVAILIFFLGMFIYKLYENKKNNKNDLNYNETFCPVYNQRQDV